jgi:hypothetical protein
VRFCTARGSTATGPQGLEELLELQGREDLERRESAVEKGCVCLLRFVRVGGNTVRGYLGLVVKLRA